MITASMLIAAENNSIIGKAVQVVDFENEYSWLEKKDAWSTHANTWFGRNTYSINDCVSIVNFEEKPSY